MKIFVKTRYIQKIRQVSKYLLFVLLLCLFYACSQSQFSAPSGTVVPWENLESLIARSESKIDKRKNDLEVTLKLKKHHFSVGESVRVEVSLKNKTAQDVVVRKLDAMPILGNDAANIHGVVFLVTSLDTGLILERGGIMLSGFIQEDFPPPVSFMALPAGKTSVANFDLSNIFEPISVGSYTLQIVYANDYFGAKAQSEQDIQFIDYDAWIGIAFSNIERFQIDP